MVMKEVPTCGGVEIVRGAWLHILLTKESRVISGSAEKRKPSICIDVHTVLAVMSSALGFGGPLGVLGIAKLDVISSTNIACPRSGLANASMTREEI